MASFRIPSGKKVYTSRYGNFKGVDFNSDDEVVSKNRFPYAQNLVIDENGYPDKRPGWAELSAAGTFNKCHLATGKIQGNEYLAVIEHSKGFSVFSKENLNSIKNGTYAQTYNHQSISPDDYATIKNSEDGFLIKYKSVYDNQGFYFYDGIKKEVLNLYDNAYVPTTVMGRNCLKIQYTDGNDETAYRTYNTPGNFLEACNMLTRKRVNCFALTDFAIPSDGSDYQYATLELDCNCDNSKDWTLEFLIDGTWKKIDIAETQKDHNKGNHMNYYEGMKFTFSNNTLKMHISNGLFYLTEPKNDGTYTAKKPDECTEGNTTDNVRITFYAESSEDKLKDCDLMTCFGISDGDRIWLSGNNKYKNYAWYSEFNNKFYFPDNNYVVIGTDETAVLGFSNYKNYLVVHKENNNHSPTLHILSGEIDSSGKALFRVKNGISGIGAVSKSGFCMCDDEPLILTKQGVFGLTVENINSEVCLKNRSYFINPMLIEEELKNAHLFEFKNYILCSNGSGKIYVMQKNLKTYINSSSSYVFECMLWTDVRAQCFAEFDDTLYFIGNGRLRCFKKKEDTPDYYNDGTDMPINAYFLTVADDDGSFMTLKTMTKRGCGIMLKPYEMSSVTVSVIKDRDFAKEIKTHRFGIFDFSKVYFETFDFRSSDAAEIVPFNTKVKKYSTLQFRVENNKENEGFGVIGIEKRFIFGNYKKS